jgi:hypothetical protein
MSAQVATKLATSPQTAAQRRSRFDRGRSHRPPQARSQRRGPEAAPVDDGGLAGDVHSRGPFRSSMKIEPSVDDDCLVDGGATTLLLLAI